MNDELEKELVPYTMVANEVLCRKDISLKAKGLFAYLFSKAPGWEFSSVRIAKECKEGRKGVLAVLSELEDAGILTRTRLATGKVKYFLKYSKSPSPRGGLRDLKPESPLGTGQFGHWAERGLISNKDNTSNKDEENNKEELPLWINQEAWNAWVEYRKEKKQKLTSKTIALQIKFLEKDIPNHVEIIEQSIRNGWTGLFPLKSNTVGSDKPVRVLKFN